MEIKETDFLIIGSGIAGLTFANRLKDSGKILVITKKRNVDSNTNYAQGGIASVFGPDDSFESHIEDTIKAGEGLSNREAVEIMVKSGPKLVMELYEMGCQFTTTQRETGRKEFDLGQEGGHSHRRIVHARDSTGREIERILIDQVSRSKSIEVIENGLVLDLIVEEDECFGAYYFDYQKNDLVAVLSNITLIATGGCGQIYKYTTNPLIATGDGVAMAYRAGAKIANMEFVQFHPTAVYNISIDGRAFLVTEAARGEGGILKTKDGKTFMENYHPLGSLAPRDIVARACYMEMKKTNADYCLLDLTHLKSTVLKERFPVIYETLIKYNIDITKDPIPVVPVAHYFCGGIKTDTWARSSIKRLLAAGEVASTGVHGANRLASNSLLEALVFARRGAEAAESYPKVSRTNLKLNYEIGSQRLHNIRDEIKDIMHRCGGIVRNLSDLNYGLDRLGGLLKMIPERLAPEDMVLRNMGEVGWLILKSASMRLESRGLHCMEDFPNKSSEFEKDTIVDKQLLVLPCPG